VCGCRVWVWGGGGGVGGGGGGTFWSIKAPLEKPPGLVSNLTPLTVAVGPLIRLMFCDDQPPSSANPTSRKTESRRTRVALPVAAMKAPIMSTDATSKWLPLTSKVQPVHPKNPPSIPPVTLVMFESAMVILLWPLAEKAPP